MMVCFLDMENSFAYDGKYSQPGMCPEIFFAVNRNLFLQDIPNFVLTEHETGVILHYGKIS
ncbi:hypothetical protein EBB54_07290 [Schaedlerella arabinosiphila]|uniref:Uncharacterized protein n=1 Tax=Schaedlerella arabinosiphila TaxID=2044587 RepID=A0A426DED6_9FIRM|nr:hypothetical protein EBB54_07290 [Schaedlerella arabinosiphila]